MRERSRDCTCDSKSPDGPGCDDDSLEQEMCEGSSCMWDCWSDWSECKGEFLTKKLIIRPFIFIVFLLNYLFKKISV